MLHLGQVVEINTWLLSAIICGREAFALSYNDLKSLDPDLATTTKPWYDFNFLAGDTEIPMLLQTLLIEVFGRTVSHLIACSSFAVTYSRLCSQPK